MLMIMMSATVMFILVTITIRIMPLLSGKNPLPIELP